jgi:hypothetical protein
VHGLELPEGQAVGGGAYLNRVEVTHQPGAHAAEAAYELRRGGGYFERCALAAESGGVVWRLVCVGVLFLSRVGAGVVNLTHDKQFPTRSIFASLLEHGDDPHEP